MPQLQRSHGRLSRTALTLLLVLQALGGGAVTLAHARDVVTTPAAVETSHDHNCLVLHDALRCALCHYAGARLIVQPALIAPPSHATGAHVPLDRSIVVVASAVHRTRPARAPPVLLSEIA